jgi:LPXTG-motif cell wall-anchored protein
MKIPIFDPMSAPRQPPQAARGHPDRRRISMQSKKLFTFAALGAMILLPACSTYAADDMTSANSAGLTNTIMDAGQFRGSLNDLKSVLNEIRDNENLAEASADPLLITNYQQKDQRLLNHALGILGTISQNWKTTSIPTMPNETADERAESSLNRLGTADAERFATESDDTAFVRNTVWDLQSDLHADKVNGRDPIVTNRMMSMLQAAINRAENPTFRVAQAVDMSRLAQLSTATTEETPFVWDRSHDMTAQAPTQPETATTTAEQMITVTPTKGGTTDDQPGAEAAVTPAPTETAEAPTTTTTEETVTSNERSGAANLPKTGGDPGMLLALGSSFIGLGAVLRRKRG